MKKSLYIGSILSAFVLSMAMPAFHYARAALVPTLSVSNISGTSQMQVTVFGADPNASVALYYPSTASYSSISIGTTNASGYLMTTIDAGTYGIAASAPVYASVDGQQSPVVNWPGYASSGGLSLNQSSVTINTGQTSTVTSSASAGLSLSANTNPSVAGVSISGNQIVISAFAAGTTNITVCASGNSCGTIYVTVPSSSSSASASISFSQTSVTVGVGQTQTISIAGSGSYYISADSNSGTASAILNGSILTVNGISAGTANISVCSSVSGGAACGSVNVTVDASALTATTNTSAASSLSFLPSSVNMTVGQSQTVGIVGGSSGASYYISNNSGPGSVSANVNGTDVTLSGVSFGGANITVCQTGGVCGIFYAYVSPTSASASSVPANTASAPSLISLSVSSDDAGGGFIGPGSNLTVAFNANQSINTPNVTIGGTPIAVTGSLGGPYTATYTVTSGTALPIPVSVVFTDPAGAGGQSYFWIGNGPSVSPSVSSSPAAAAPASAVLCPAGLVCTPSASASSVSTAASSVSGGPYSFERYLYIGMTPMGVPDPDVRALQQRLLSDGFFSGPVTGYFGPLTKSAVEAYQTAHSLDPIGVVGPSTRNLLNRGI